MASKPRTLPPEPVDQRETLAWKLRGSQHLARLVALRDSLDPFALSRSVERQLVALYALRNPRHNPKPATARRTTDRSVLAS